MKKKPIIPIVILVVAALGYLVWKAWDRGPFLYAGTVEATEVDVPARLGTLIAATPCSGPSRCFRGCCSCARWYSA